MNVYDQANQLARSIRESDEYKEYQRLKETAYADSTNKALLDEYKRLQFKMQLKMAQGESMDSDDMERLQKISNLLQFNSDASAFLFAELRFQRIIADVYKILAGVSGIDTELFQ